MKRKNSNLIKILLIFGIICLCCVLASASYFVAVTATAKLNTSKLDGIVASSLNFQDRFGNKIETSQLNSKQNYISYEDLNQYTIDAFVSVEDKRFFEHNGVDYLRILGALKNNILHPKRKQGGSTITQQLVKNTQLSREKTIKRKLKELKLAKKIEKSYSKQEILEMYLNSIYFGNGCYGIENASRYYFNKSASNLNIEESALLASTINAPSIYDPINNRDKALERKDLILKLMLDNKKITTEQYYKSNKAIINICKANQNYKNQYYKGVIDEACKILKVTENQLKNYQYTINTYYDSNIQAQLEYQITSNSYTGNNDKAKLGSIVLDNKNCAVVAFASNGGLDLLNTYRQPGSAIKPIIVYAPAFEFGKYSPASFITDEPLNINGYAPENASKNYIGNTNIRNSIIKSLNIPAVKVLNDIGINYAKSFASNIGISFENADNNLALALGGFTKGTTIKQLADAYMSFANMGKFSNSSFISSIYNGDTPLYERNIYIKDAFSTSTSYLINSCLKDVAKSGTAKRLSDLNINVASKTGTVGNKNGNTDAYNVSYTTSHTSVCWIGSNKISEPLPANINGATYPTLFNKALLQKIYNLEKPDDWIMPNDVCQIKLNSDAINEQKLEADDNGTITEYFNQKYVPNKSNRSSLYTNINVNNYEGQKPIISFFAKRDLSYQLMRTSKTTTEIIENFSYISGNVDVQDLTAESGKIYEYYIIVSKENDVFISNKLKLLAN